MNRPDILTCVHEPFGDAFYFGPERLSSRYEQDEKARQESGFGNSTFKTIFERIEREGKEVRSNFAFFFLRPCIQTYSFILKDSVQVASLLLYFVISYCHG
jgi:hypothetical protein